MFAFRKTTDWRAGDRHGLPQIEEHLEKLAEVDEKDTVTMIESQWPNQVRAQVSYRLVQFPTALTTFRLSSRADGRGTI